MYVYMIMFAALMEKHIIITPDMETVCITTTCVCVCSCVFMCVLLDVTQVGGVTVVGLERSEVVQLLREAMETVTILVSRQEVVEDLQVDHQEVNHVHTLSHLMRVVVAIELK